MLYVSEMDWPKPIAMRYALTFFNRRENAPDLDWICLPRDSYKLSYLQQSTTLQQGTTHSLRQLDT